MTGRTPPAATVGVAEHASSAVFVTLARDGALLDRREIRLTDPGLSSHPHHHEGSWAVGRYLDSPWARPISLADAVALVERVRESAARRAREGLEALAASVPVPITRLAIRECPELPAATEDRIRDNRAQTIADGVLYRQALAAAAAARGWSVQWYDRDRVFEDAAAAVGGQDIDALLSAMGRSVGPPWQAKHKLAAAAALAAAGSTRSVTMRQKPSSANAGPRLLSGGNPQIAKADGDAPVQAYVAAMPGWTHDVGRRLDALVVRTVPDVKKAVKWNSPLYGIEGRGWFLGFHVFARFVKVTFFKGTSLKPAPPGGAAKEARWIDVHEDDLDEAQMKKWVKQAAAIPGWGNA